MIALYGCIQKNLNLWTKNSNDMFWMNSRIEESVPENFSTYSSKKAVYQ